MRNGLIAACFMFGQAAAVHALEPRELVHGYGPTGPAEVAGTAAASKVLRTMQRHAVPAFTDMLALHVAHTLQGASDPPVTVTRKPRRGGHDAAAAVASAAPDGRRLLLAGTTAALELKSIARVASMPFVLIAESGSHSSRHDLIRSAGPRMLVGSAGERTVGHLAIEHLRTRHGSRIEAVAYNGGIAALNAVVAKQVSTALVPLPSVLPYLGGGRIRIRAVAEPRRHPAIAHVPTTAQAGLADFEAVGWFEVLAPPATPRPIIQELSALLANGPQSNDARQLFTDLGLRLEHVPVGAPARTAAR